MLSFSLFFYGITLPMRDWDEKVDSFIVNKFFFVQGLHYLWGIETNVVGNQWRCKIHGITLPMRDWDFLTKILVLDIKIPPWDYITYEGLRHYRIEGFIIQFIKDYITYEGLRHTRHWYFDHNLYRDYITYEGLRLII